MGFSRQEYWSGLSFPSPGYLPNPGTKPASPVLQADSLPSEPPGKKTVKIIVNSPYDYHTHFFRSRHVKISSNELSKRLHAKRRHQDFRGGTVDKNLHASAGVLG